MAGGLDARRIEPELLDSLPPADARAMASRRDLVRVNALMFQAAIMAGLLGRHVGAPPKRVLEIGCGDGRFMLSVARRLSSRWGGGDMVLLDQARLITDERRAQFAALGWRVEPVEADVFAWLEANAFERFDVISANLFLHHFAEDRLRVLFSAAQRMAPAFVATEPRRNRFAYAATALLRFVGANGVTLHDAAASVRAGFSGKELSRLWPATANTRLEERPVGPFTHMFAARAAPKEDR